MGCSLALQCISCAPARAQLSSALQPEALHAGCPQ
eukprot:CAMPEP_0197902058 /NCGR_PEP_ID=MMETSP1439-20131203/52532_1 /TAXON_ID=66791 /ORGANISM="Gonyaulax spinifera, Strain CCMP409" /LENGTH=34 /DNA_ID= /DNA_START= /DNA_END= /DNA_ORIENTATION=